MQSMKRAALFVSLIIISLLGFSQSSGFIRKQIVFNPETTGFYIFRIPSIVTTKKGNIMVFAEGRKGKGGDWDPSNLVYRASYDAGQTWTDLSILVDKGNTTCSNAVPIFDFFEDKIHLLFTVGYNSVFYMYSLDEGISWENPLNITDAFEGFKAIYPWKVVATGPGHGTQLSSGRIIVPIWFSSSGELDTINNTLPHYPSVTGLLYSDDFGKSWLVGDIISPNNDTLVFPNEASCVELASGEVMFNMRNESLNYRRLVSYSPDGVSGWSKPYYSDNFFEPICHASMIRYSVQPFQDKNRILFTNPDSRMIPWSSKRGTTIKAAPKRQRSNLTLRLSYDEGITFPVYKEIEEAYAGYSDLSVGPDGIIHCLYECGLKTSNNRFLPGNISLSSFDLQWATNGKDSLSVNDMPVFSNMNCAVYHQNPGPVKKKKYLFKKNIVRTCD